MGAPDGAPVAPASMTISATWILDASSEARNNTAFAGTAGLLGRVATPLRAPKPDELLRAERGDLFKGEAPPDASAPHMLVSPQSRWDTHKHSEQSVENRRDGERGEPIMQRAEQQLLPLTDLQVLQNPFRLFVGALAEVMIAQTPLRIHNVKGRPVVIRERVPDCIVVIDRDRILDPHVPGGPAHVLEVVFKWELRRVYSDHHDAVIPVFVGPGADIGQGAQPVDAGVGPEVDED